MGAHECVREVAATAYIGEVCYLPAGHGTLFRLYDARTGRLLAERTYSDLDPGMVWADDKVFYLPERYVSLPPSWLDRIRAMLP